MSSSPEPDGTGLIRLSKLMAQRGICSRREADVYIERGWVLVDGQRVSTLGTKVDPDCKITLDGRAKARQSGLVTILLNKPVGYVSGQPEKGYKTAVSLIKPGNQFVPEGTEKRELLGMHLRGIAPAGRLDIDSQGLIVFTQDGRVAKKLVGEGAGIEKEYLVRVEGEPDAGGMNLLRHGLSLDGRELRPAKVTRLNPDQLKFILTEGRKRQIRRMCELVGLKVTGIKRVRIGGVVLGKLPEGSWRFLGEDEEF